MDTIFVTIVKKANTAIHTKKIIGLDGEIISTIAAAVLTMGGGKNDQIESQNAEK